MLSELTRLHTAEEQVEQLEKVHQWATRSHNFEDNTEVNNSKSRPGTASTRTRPATAYSRPQTGASRPGTATSYAKKIQKEPI